jgi:hypothetical protein
VVVAELKLSDVAVQVLTAAMLIDALHAALEDREAAFQRVRVDVVTHILASAVLNDAMLGEAKADLDIYQHCGRQHLHRYVAEFEFRHNHRIANEVNDTERAALILKAAEGRRLTYRRPVAWASA